MKKSLCFIFVMILSILSIHIVYADCTSEEISSLKKEAEKIKVTYKHLGAIENDLGGIEYNHFNLTFKKLPSDVYIENNIGIHFDMNEDGIINFDWISGKTIFYIFSNKCNQKIYELSVVIPYFNEYSLDPLCEGIDGSKFSLCSKYKYTTYTVSYDTFKKKVEEYKKSNPTTEVKKEDRKQIRIVDTIIALLKEYKFYIISMLGILILIAFIVYITLKRKKRGVLK